MGAALPAAASAHDLQRVKSVEEGIAAFIHEFQALRRDLHQHPELSFQEHRTSAIVAERLASWGYEVTTGIAGTGLVGTLRRGQGTKTLGIRADMDALPITEATGLPYASQNAGVMHACGHDGHTTVLLAAARFLAESGRFDGTLNLIFQPAEENGGGAHRMIGEGLFERFPCDAVFGLHNWPCVGAGHFGCVTGPAMASVDQITITVRGKGGHGAAPHETVDPVVASAHIITALQTVVSRNVDPLDMGVVTVGSIHGGNAPNVVPESVELKLTARAFKPEVREVLKERIPAIARAQAESFGATADVLYRPGYPAVLNHEAETELARSVAIDTFGAARVDAGFRPRTASEDFAFMLLKRPGSYVFVGNGDGASLHSPYYDFNDAILAPSATYWVRLAERFLA
ncbi:amidohydrolase [Acidovorax sp. Leaf76]|uniref:M20 aminoacylase family protein n=1 Tax=unclassified Acidovorax TaxID=2684926 RepID=UPI0006FEF17D|nr:MULTISPECIES: M20 aminoacylase family protein [unclassified Acidovorax]KQO20304.1 amidohydrolase [Acidovorax sp. Leaf76]KQO33234.1 amidohydrolase [Acidovorax sp. Leaf84]KQS28527.1 amidohydrolase [Acidovorax sp. Leaf191]